MASRGATPHEIDAVLDAAIRSYDRVGNLKDWELVQFAEALVLRGQAERALRELDRAKKRDPYWNHRRAQALRALGDLVLARTAVDQGLEPAGSDRRATATLLHERWRIRRDAGEVDAIADLKAARDSATGRFRDELAAEVERVDATAPAW